MPSANRKTRTAPRSKRAPRNLAERRRASAARIRRRVIGSTSVKLAARAAALALEAFKSYAGRAPHARQMEVFECLARFVAATAGSQSGKTVSAALLFWKRIIQENRPDGIYWMVAPDSIVGTTQRRRFVALAPRGMILNKRITDRTLKFELATGSIVEFRTGYEPDRLRAETIHGVWVDEFTTCKPDVWRGNLRSRLAATGGWAIFSGTPAGQNWAYSDIWKRTLEGEDQDDEFAGFTWPTADNPAVSEEEIKAARAQLPDAYFRREYEASWEAFHGQIYDAFGDHLIAEPPPEALELGQWFIGVDWGYSNPGCALLMVEHEERVYVVEEVYESQRLQPWWEDRIDGLVGKTGRKHKRSVPIYCDPAEPDRIAGLVSEGLRAHLACNDRRSGIRKVACLFFAGTLIVSSRCKTLIGQIRSYAYKRDRLGRSTEEPSAGNDHALDALRYGVVGHAGAKPVPAERASRGTAHRSRRRA